MTTRKSILMLSNTGDGPDKFTVYGEKIRAGSYYGYGDGIHTVQVSYTNFTGAFGLQGTLSLNPSENDWFWIKLNDSSGTISSDPFITYPRDPLNPTGSISGTLTVGDSGTQAFTLVGNFTYLRAVMYREYLDPKPIQSIDGRWRLGQIDKVLLCI